MEKTTQKRIEELRSAAAGILSGMSFEDMYKLELAYPECMSILRRSSTTVKDVADWMEMVFTESNDMEAAKKNGLKAGDIVVYVGDSEFVNVGSLCIVDSVDHTGGNGCGMFELHEYGTMVKFCAPGSDIHISYPYENLWMKQEMFDDGGYFILLDDTKWFLYDLKSGTYRITKYGEPHEIELSARKGIPSGHAEMFDIARKCLPLILSSCRMASYHMESIAEKVLSSMAVTFDNGKFAWSKVNEHTMLSVDQKYMYDIMVGQTSACYIRCLNDSKEYCILPLEHNWNWNTLVRDMANKIALSYTSVCDMTKTPHFDIMMENGSDD